MPINETTPHFATVLWPNMRQNIPDLLNADLGCAALMPCCFRSQSPGCSSISTAWCAAFFLVTFFSRITNSKRTPTFGMHYQTDLVEIVNHKLYFSKISDWYSRKQTLHVCSMRLVWGFCDVKEKTQIRKNAHGLNSKMDQMWPTCESEIRYLKHEINHGLPSLLDLKRAAFLVLHGWLMRPDSTSSATEGGRRNRI